MGIAQWLECRTYNQMVTGWSPSRIKKISRFNFLCKLSFWYLFHPCVTAVAHKWSQSLCQKCRWQVTAKHTWCTIHMWLQTKWQCKPVHGCVVYKEHTLTAAVSHGTSHVIVTTNLPNSIVSTPLLVDIQKPAVLSYSMQLEHSGSAWKQRHNTVQSRLWSTV